MDEIATKTDSWVDVVYGKDRFIGKRKDGSYISTRGEDDNWVWVPATEDEIEYFNTGDINE